MSDREVHKSFFNKLKETVRDISENLAEIEQEMTTPKCDLPKQSALQKLDYVEKDLDIAKEQAVRLLADVRARTNQLRSYNANMRELITEMEEKYVNIMDLVKKYGYKPDAFPTTDNQIEHVEENANCIATPGIKMHNGNSKLDKPLERTPLLIDYGLMSTRKSNVKNELIENSVQKKQVSQNEFAKMSRPLNSNDFVTPLKQPSTREEKTLPQKLEEILEKTPMIDYSALYKDFTMALDTNDNCTEVFQLRKPLDLDFTESQASNSTPELPFNSTFRLQNKDKTEKEVHVTPELPPSDVIKEAVKQAEKTPELKLSVFGAHRRDKK